MPGVQIGFEVDIAPKPPAKAASGVQVPNK
jgi:hypothetical protein